MKAIILAAGMGNRLLHLTQDMPKCKVKLRGRPLIEHQLEALRQNGVNDIVIVKGYLQEQIVYPGTRSCLNTDYPNNNVLESLFCAESELDDEVIVAYSDILYAPSIIERLMKVREDIAVVVDEHWQEHYRDRVLHPVTEAEKVSLQEGRVRLIGKHLTAEVASGEFIGVAKFSKRGAEQLRHAYQDARKRFGAGAFQQAKTFRKAYLTDLLQEMINHGQAVHPLLIQGGWVEIDTVEDLKRAGGAITSAKITPEARRGRLKELLSTRGFARIMESHNGISAIVASNAVLAPNKTAFDGLWVSSLTESAARGQPDIELTGLDTRLATAAQIIEVTNKPLILDGDTGGDPNTFEYFVRRAEGLGVSAVVIEDQSYPKRNSLDGDSEHRLENPMVFASKIRRGVDAVLTSDFMIFARIESLIAGQSVADALQRAEVYLDAGADGILIHSRDKTPDRIFEFARGYETLFSGKRVRKPLVCVPTSYSGVREPELRQNGFNVVIYANHLLRSSIRAMQTACQSILQQGRAQEADSACTPVEELFDLVGFSDLKNKEKTSWRI